MNSLLVRKKLKSSLEEKGFTQIFEASDGEEAVAFCQNEKPDVVLLDIVMPKKDGIEALKEIKVIKEDTYIVMASSVGTQSNLIKALKAGANTFLQKPVSPEAVIETIEQLIKERGEG